MSAHVGSTPFAFLRAMRVHHWLKNLLVYLPLITSHRLGDAERLTHATLAFLAFSLAASAGYLLNDVTDASYDRRDAIKRYRPVAAGALRPATAVAAGVAFAGSALIIAAMLTGMFRMALVAYLVLAAAYSLWFRRIVILDVVMLAGFYCLRVIAGGIATDTLVSPWLLAFSMFFFLSLAVLKRYTELRLLDSADQQAIGRGYRLADAELLHVVGPVSGYLSVLVLALYINSGTAAALYRSPQTLWLAGPLLIYWISRLWLLAHRGEVRGDPLLFAARDRTTYLAVTLFAAILLAGSTG